MKIGWSLSTKKVKIGKRCEDFFVQNYIQMKVGQSGTLFLKKKIFCICLFSFKKMWGKLVTHNVKIEKKKFYRIVKKLTGVK